MEAFFGVAAQFRDCLQFLEAVELGVLAQEEDEEEEERDEQEADERDYRAIEEGEKHAANKTAESLKQLPLTVAQAFINLRKILSNIARHLLHIVLFEKCDLLLQEAPQVHASELDGQLLG